jgi:hypothetical protein
MLVIIKTRYRFTCRHGITRKNRIFCNTAVRTSNLETKYGSIAQRISTTACEPTHGHKKKCSAFVCIKSQLENYVKGLYQGYINVFHCRRNRKSPKLQRLPRVVVPETVTTKPIICITSDPILLITFRSS